MRLRGAVCLGPRTEGTVGGGAGRPRDPSRPHRRRGRHDLPWPVCPGEPAHLSADPPSVHPAWGTAFCPPRLRALLLSTPSWPLDPRPAAFESALRGKKKKKKKEGSRGLSSQRGHCPGRPSHTWWLLLGPCSSRNEGLPGCARPLPRPIPPREPTTILGRI